MKSRRQPILLFAAWAAFICIGFGCQKKQYLTGYYTWNEFRSQAKWDVFVDDKYKPGEEYLDSIQALGLKDSLHVRLFLGTYCGDSKKWVPRFYRIKPELPVAGVEIVSVDTTKKDARGYWKEAKLEKIPTFIFYNSENREVGRIVEKPKKGLERSIFKVLKGAGTP